MRINWKLIAYLDFDFGHRRLYAAIYNGYVIFQEVYDSGVVYRVDNCAFDTEEQLLDFLDRSIDVTDAGLSRSTRELKGSIRTELCRRLEQYLAMINRNDTWAGCTKCYYRGRMYSGLVCDFCIFQPERYGNPSQQEPRHFAWRPKD